MSDNDLRKQVSNANSESAKHLDRCFDQAILDAGQCSILNEGIRKTTDGRYVLEMDFYISDLDRKHRVSCYIQNGNAKSVKCARIECETAVQEWASFQRQRLLRADAKRPSPAA